MKKSHTRTWCKEPVEPSRGSRKFACALDRLQRMIWRISGWIHAAGETPHFTKTGSHGTDMGLVSCMLPVAANRGHDERLLILCLR